MQPNAEMSSCQATFDLKAAREAMARATERPNVTTDIYHLAALTYLPAALDEIERLQAEQSDFKYKFLTMFIGKLCSKHAGDNTLPLPEFERLCHEHCFFCLIEKNQEQAKRMAELETDVLQKSMLAGSLARETAGLKKRVTTLEIEVELSNYYLKKDEIDLVLKCRRQRAALKKLGQAKRERGKALVEERAKTACLLHPIRLCGLTKEDYQEAREQLRLEGKL